MPPGKKLSRRPDRCFTELDRGRRTVGRVEDDPIQEDEAKVALARMEERPITAEERQYWAFRPPVRPAVPQIGAANPIDAFLRHAMQSKGLKPSPPADKRTLIRRAYLDMTGLPPTTAAGERISERSIAESLFKGCGRSACLAALWRALGTALAGPGSLCRFRRVRVRSRPPNAWRYRDYVIRSFNEDKPYDRFLKEQIAGDELWPDSADARIATGYLRLGLENNLKNEQTRLDEFDDLVATTSNAFLGVTVGCARCHNHKFDPIPQKDYYGMQAVFFPTKPYEYPLVPG